jgi:Icc protein
MTELTIAHISDIHAGSPYFVPSLMDRVVVELNELEPDIVLCTGDLTEMGFRQDYVTAKEYWDRIEAPRIVIPGNHDARNVGYVHFEQLFGPRWHSISIGDVHIVALDSTEPDLDHGQIGRAKYEWLREEYKRPAAFRVFMLHHHLLPVPGTGRERTCSSLRLRGNTKACYNLIRIEDDRVQVARKYPFHGEETLIDFVPSTASFDKYICPVPQEESR